MSANFPTADDAQPATGSRPADADTRTGACNGAGSGTLDGVFTVDVEDYFNVSAFEKDISRDRWNDFQSRVEPNTHRLLDLLDEHRVLATFFVLGWTADKHPGLVREIERRGHEIASHSYWHRLVYRQSPDEFRRDLRRSKQVLEDLTGQPVVAYRAPTYSITQDSLWALPILVEEGFQVDSSFFPIRHDRGGLPNSPREAHRIETSSGNLWEYPLTVARIAGANVPVSGGGYFRLFPSRWTSYWLAQARRATGRPFMFYIHPWEIDPGQPRLQAGSRASRLRHYLKLARTESKVARLLKNFRFGRLADALAGLES